MTEESKSPSDEAIWKAIHSRRDFSFVANVNCTVLYDDDKAVIASAIRKLFLEHSRAEAEEPGRMSFELWSSVAAYTKLWRELMPETKEFWARQEAKHGAHWANEGLRNTSREVGPAHES